MKFRKKPVEVEAIRFTGFDDSDAIKAFFGDQPFAFATDSELWIETLEGTMRANIGDWIIKGVAGEFYPCKPDIFVATYEPVVKSADQAYG